MNILSYRIKNSQNSIGNFLTKVTEQSRVEKLYVTTLNGVVPIPCNGILLNLKQFEINDRDSIFLEKSGVIVTIDLQHVGKWKLLNDKIIRISFTSDLLVPYDNNFINVKGSGFYVGVFTDTIGETSRILNEINVPILFNDDYLLQIESIGLQDKNIFWKENFIKEPSLVKEQNVNGYFVLYIK